MRYVIAFLCLICFVLSSCHSQRRFDTSFIAMGTRVDLSVMSDDSAQAAQATMSVEQSLLQWSKDWYPWGATPGELKNLNATFAQGRKLKVSMQLRDLLQLSKQLSIKSEGYFDPAVAPMMRAWGLNDMSHTQTTSPDEEALHAWKHNHPTIKDVITEANQISSTRSDIQLDLGAIAKGYAIDLCMQLLKQRNINSAAINLGGQVRIMGEMDKVIREVHIRDPRMNASMATLILNSGESISTSGDYERYRMQAQQRIHHILDPHTGAPVADTQAVTVIADNATLADVASTAIMAAGAEHWQYIAQQLGISQVLRVDATGEIQITTAMHKRLHWEASALQSYSLVQIH